MLSNMPMNIRLAPTGSVLIAFSRGDACVAPPRQVYPRGC